METRKSLAIANSSVVFSLFMMAALVASMVVYIAMVASLFTTSLS